MSELIFKCKHYGGPVADGWGLEGKTQVRVYPDPTPPPDIDHLVRFYRTEDGTEAGYGFLDDNGEWQLARRQQILDVLMHRGHKRGPELSGQATCNPFTAVARPFSGPYPGPRMQNLFSAQYAEPPAQFPGPTPIWDGIFSHTGQGLDEAVQADPWCREHGLQFGRDWLRLWAASMLQNPADSLPYLFLTGPQNAGKTSLSDALRLLMTKGVVDAEEALTSSSGFNGPLAGAVLCLIDETFIGESSTAYARLKKWTTSHRITIRALYSEQIELPNYCHWIQTANDKAACPVFDGDSRIVMIEVPEIPAADRIRWKDLEQQLIAERADVLGQLLNIELPPSNERLFLPVLETEVKRQALSSGPATPDLLTALKPLAGRTMKTSKIFKALPKGIAANVATLGKMLKAVGAELVGRSTWYIPEALFRSL